MKKILPVLFPLAAAIAAAAWYFNSASAPAGSLFSDGPGLLLAFGRLAGITGALGVLAQLLLVSRASWLEPLFGLDKLTRWHHVFGLVVPLALLAHPPLIVWHHALQNGSGFISQYLDILRWEDVLAAAAGEALILLAVFLSLPFARRRLSYEVWHTAHLGAYLGLALSIGHQLELGGDMNAGSQVFAGDWYLLLSFVAANLLWFRLLKPLWAWRRHRFAVASVHMETDSVMSVHLAGRDLENFSFEAGQFALLRFWAPYFRWQAHPFSFSREPGGGLRFSIKKLGDFTARLHAGLKPGTPVIIDGPYGVFTAARMRRRKALLVAGGIGITPLRALAGQLTAEGEECLLVYANRRRSDIAFADELAGLEKAGLKVVHVLSDEPGWEGEKGVVDAAMLARLAPDLAERDAFLCGPPPMMAALRRGLKAAGVPGENIHYEAFSL